MSIKVRYFASLKETLGRAEDNLDIDGASTVAAIWAIANPDYEMPANILSAVNMEYVATDCLVNDQDEVAFFPPVTGGSGEN